MNLLKRLLAIGISISLPTWWLDASRDRCARKDCGVQRRVHGRDHAFVEKEES